MQEDFQDEIGAAAGAIWRYISRHGRVTANALSHALDMSPRRVDQAVGWLAREEKIRFNREKRTVFLALR